MSLLQQMRRIRRSNTFFGQMPSDAQIRGALSFFDGLMPRPRVARWLLLGPNALSQPAIKRVPMGQSFQTIAVGSFAVVSAPLLARKLSFANLRRVLRLIALLKERLFVCFEFRNCVRLLTRDLLAFFFNSFDSFINPRDP